MGRIKKVLIEDERRCALWPHLELRRSFRPVDRVSEVAPTENERRYAACSSPFMVANLMADWWRQLPDDGQERICVLLLDAHNYPMGLRVVSMGTVSGSLAHPRDVFSVAIAAGGCVSIILMHSHPSGRLDPSDEDYLVTQRLVDAGYLLGIPVLDHLIFDPGKPGEEPFSFDREGLMPEPMAS